MTPEQELIEDIKINASEYIEMTENPDAVVSGILAYKIIQMQSYIEYLEKRLHAKEANAR